MDTIRRNAVAVLFALASTTPIHAMPLVSAALAADKAIHLRIAGTEKALIQGLREQGYFEGKESRHRTPLLGR